MYHTMESYNSYSTKTKRELFFVTYCINHMFRCECTGVHAQTLKWAWAVKL